jgi:urease alpha subunit
MPWVPARIGDARTAEGAYVWQKLRHAGARLASGSDFPSSSRTRCRLLRRHHQAGARRHAGRGWAPDQRLTRDEALRSFTIDAAYAAHQETRSGSLEAGKLADLVILSRDIMQVPPREILTTTVVLTVSGGQVTHDTSGGIDHGRPLTRMPDIAVPVSLAALAMLMLATIVAFATRASRRRRWRRIGWWPNCGWRRSPPWCWR